MLRPVGPYTTKSCGRRRIAAGRVTTHHLNRDSSQPRPFVEPIAERRLLRQSAKWKRILQGAIAGLTATAPMTAAMEAGADKLPKRERYPLPPRIITTRIARQVGVAVDEDDDAIKIATIAAHFGYGAAMGAIYSAITPPKYTGPTTGVAFGLGVWAGSYLGALPALGILTPATEHPARRNLLMIAAHVVWGSALGATLHSLQSDNEES